MGTKITFDFFNQINEVTTVAITEDGVEKNARIMRETWSIGLTSATAGIAVFLITNLEIMQLLNDPIYIYRIK